MCIERVPGPAGHHTVSCELFIGKACLYSNDIFIDSILSTKWHENLTVIKFYGLSKLLKYKKSTDFKFYGNRSNLVSLQHNSKS